MNSVMASAANAADKPCSIEGTICNFINKIAKAFRPFADAAAVKK